jgi:hypothetical protein
MVAFLYKSLHNLDNEYFYCGAYDRYILEDKFCT